MAATAGPDVLLKRCEAFASSVFVPVATFPDWLQAFAKINPVTVTADTARSLALSGTPELTCIYWWQAASAPTRAAR